MFTVEDFNPRKPVLIIDNLEIELSLITLEKDVIFKDKYGSINKIFEKIKENPFIIFDVVWILVIDKSIFNHNFENFKNTLQDKKTEQSLTTKASLMSECLNDCFVKSMPLIKNKKRYKEIQEIKGGTEDSKPCYARYFDTVAKRYGYKIDEFYNLTLRHLHILLKTIGDKQHEELEVKAALADKKLTPRIKYEDISEEQEEDQEKQAQEALKSLKERYEKTQKEL